MLRNRRLAIALIVATLVFAASATLLPLGDPRAPSVATWAAAHPELERIVGPLGLHQPFTTPVFIALACLLALTTAACSWERTQRALALWRAARPEAWIEREGAPHPTFVVPTPDGLAGASRVSVAAFERLRMTPIGDDARRVATRWRIACFGSPLFHWALVALFLAVGAGQLLRSEGDIAVVSGSSSVDERGSYAPGLSTGPLFGNRFTGWELEVREVAPDLNVGGVSRGDTPYVRILSKQAVLTEGYVYPNHPLRRGGVIVHRGGLGPAVFVSFQFPNGARVAKRPLALVNSFGNGGAWATLVVTEQESAKSTTLKLETAKGQRVVLSVPDQGFRSRALSKGEDVRLPDGTTVRLDDSTVFVRLTVVNDWSVPFIYAAFILAVIGELFALLMPPRVVVAAYRPAEGDLAVWVLRTKVDPAFPSRVERAFGHDRHADTKERS